MAKKRSKKLGREVAKLISQTHYRSAVRLLGNSIDPTNPIVAGRNKISPRIKERAATVEAISKMVRKGNGKKAAIEIARARKEYKDYMRVENFAKTATAKYQRKGANMLAVSRSRRAVGHAATANEIVSDAKAWKAKARSSGIYGLAATWLAGEILKKKRG